MILERHLKVHFEGGALSAAQLVAETERKGGVQMLRGMGVLKFVRKEDEEGEGGQCFSFVVLALES